MFVNNVPDIRQCIRRIICNKLSASARGIGTLLLHCVSRRALS